MLEQHDYPINVEDFLTNFNGRGYLNYLVRKFNLRDALSTPDDLVQDLILALIERNYFENFDSDKGSWKGYLSKFVKNYLIRLYKKECWSVNGYKILGAAPIINGSPEDYDELTSGVIFSDLLEGESGISDYNLFVEDIKKELQDKFHASSSTIYEGKEVLRDPLTAFNFLLEDKTISEIATIMQTSKQFVYSLMEKIRSIDALKFHKRGA